MQYVKTICHFSAITMTFSTKEVEEKAVVIMLWVDI